MGWGEAAPTASALNLSDLQGWAALTQLKTTRNIVGMMSDALEQKVLPLAEAEENTDIWLLLLKASDKVFGLLTILFHKNPFKYTVATCFSKSISEMPN